MATSWASETDEKVNYTKLCRLLYDGGTLAVRTVLDGRCPPASLGTTLTTNRSKLQKLKKPTGKVLNQGQWDKLYPPSGASPKSEDFDITLLFVLLRNICGLTPPATGWDVLPPSTDTSLEANLARIKYYRNNVAHISEAEVDDTLFETYWKGISGALVSLGLKQDDIDELKSSPLGTDKYNQLVNDWYSSDQDIKSRLEAIQLGIDELRERNPSYRAIDRLAHRDFSRRIDKLCDKYHPNTREWLLTDVKSYVDNRNRNIVVVIKAAPGMGKSVAAAKLCQQYRQQGNLGGCHFFRHDNSLQNDPRLMLQSVARQLCDAYPEYRDVLETNISKNLGKDMSELSCVELFTLLFEEPCSKLSSKSHYVIIIDALDECCNSLKKDLFRVLTDKISVLPSWLRFVLTTRPPPSMSSLSWVGQIINIDPKDPRNNSDILTYFTDKLEATSSDHNRNQITQLVDVTEGLFLVAFFVFDFLRKTNVNSISEAVEQFPKGRGTTSVYEDYFSRLQKEITPHIQCEEGFFEMLDAIVAAKFPIEKSMLYSILGLLDEPRVPNNERKEAINHLHQLFPVENDHVSAFHKTVIDWLTTGDHDYRVKGDGCGVLANKCYDVINSIKQNIHHQDESPDLTDRDKYALTFGSEYYEESFSEEKKIEMQTDPEVLCLEAFFAVQDYYNSDYGYENLFEQHLSNDCRAIYDDLKKLFTLEKTHSTSWHKHPTYVKLLEFAYQAANLLKIGDTVKSLDYLKEKGIAYHERQTLLELNEEGRQVKQVLECHNGFLLVLHKNIKTLVRKYQLNRNLVKEVLFDGNKKLYMSPDNRFNIVAIPLEAKGDIDIIDTDTLQIHNSYESPNVVRSCHVFGSQPWYMVVRCFNNKIYVMDGETGKLVGHPTAVQQNDDVLGVSKVGNILIARTSDSCVLKYQFSDRRFTDENGYFCESMAWEKVNHGRNVLPPSNQGESTSPSHDNYVYRELFLSDYKSIDDKMPIYARKPARCQCRRYYENTDSLRRIEQPLCLSEDGDLLAFYHGQCITVVHTSDGSLYKSVCLFFNQVYTKKILFFSKERMIIHDKLTDNIFCLKFGENEYEVLLEHIFYLPEDVDISWVLTSKENNLMALIVEKFTAKTKWVNHRPQMEKSTDAIQKYIFF